MNLHSIYFPVLTFVMIGRQEGGVSGEKGDNIGEVTSAEMMPNPHKILEEHQRLTSLTWEGRGKLCLEKISQVKKPVFAQDGLYDLVLPPHKYKFDDDEELLAIRCLTVPTIYIGLPIYGKIPPTQLYIRTMNSLKKYNFSFEVASELSAAGTVELSAFNAEESKRKTHIFRKLEKEEYWNPCNEALKVIQYEPRWNAWRIERPKVYTYNIKGHCDTYLTILCPSTPIMFIHAGEAGVGDKFTIVFRKNEIGSMKVRSVDE